MSTTVVDRGFRARLNHLLQRFGSVAEMARRVGVSDNAIYKWLSGRGQPTVANLVALAKTAGVSIEWLATGNEVSTMSRATDGSVQIGDYVFPQRHSLKLSDGRGSLNSEQIVDYLAFRADWVASRLNTEPRNLMLVENVGDAMSPTLRDSDLLLVDLTEPGFRHDGMYVLRREDALAVRRVQRRGDGNLLVFSDNAAYESLLVASDDLYIVGRVLWISGRL
jgi:phage repressor protein C with HTH and peptisase S24 domain